MTADIFGPSAGIYRAERAFEATLQAWLPDHLAHVERQEGLAPGTLSIPKSWATVSEIDFDEGRLPAVIVVSPGAGDRPRHQGGKYDATWQIDLVIITAAAKERDARASAALMLQAARDAIIQNPTLGGAVSETYWVGGDNHTAGRPRGNLPGQRAVFSTTFEVVQRQVVDQRAGTTEPTSDPYSPPPAPESPLTADITVTATSLEDTP